MLVGLVVVVVVPVPVMGGGNVGHKSHCVIDQASNYHDPCHHKNCAYPPLLPPLTHACVSPDEALTPTPSAGDNVVSMTNAIKLENAVREVMEVAGSRLFLVPATMGFNGQ